MNDSHIRRSGLAALLGGVLVVILPLLESYAFHGGTTIGWVVAARPIGEPLVRFARRFASADEVLYVFGRPQAFAFLLLMLGYIGLHARLSRHNGRVERLGYCLAVLALLLALAGNIGDMWLGKYVWGTANQWVAQLGGGLLLLGAVVLSAASILIGVAILRANAMPSWTAWLLIIAAIFSIPLALAFIQGLSAVYLLFGPAWIAVGYILWRGPSENTAEPDLSA